MSKLVWDTTYQRRYETGVDRGVLYPLQAKGVVWNGLLSVAEGSLNGDLKSFAFDGITYRNAIGSKDFQVTVKAFSAPREFGPCIGDVEIVPGFILTRQPKSRFNFSFRTMIDNYSYKIHLVYNASATPTSRSYSTTNDTPKPVNLEWLIDTIPFVTNTYRPTAHYIIDSTKVDKALLVDFENILYGGTGNDASMPTADQLVHIFSNYLTEPLTEPV